MKVNNRLRAIALGTVAAGSIALAALTGAAPAATATANPITVPPGVSAANYTNSWGGYSVTAPKGRKIAVIAATWTIPSKAFPSRSLGPTPYNATEWAGLDGLTKGQGGPEQCGVWEQAKSKSATPVYELFWEMYPSGPQFTWNGSEIVQVHPGNIVTAWITYSNETGFFGYHEFQFEISVAANSKSPGYDYTAFSAKTNSPSRTTAEVITEIPGNGGVPLGALDMGTIGYTGADYALQSTSNADQIGPSIAVTKKALTMRYGYGKNVLQIEPSAPSKTPGETSGLLDRFYTFWEVSS